MNIFNRVLVVLDILLTMLVITILLAFPEGSLSVIIASAATISETISRIRPEYLMLFHAVLIVIAIVIDFALLLLLVYELRGPRHKTIRVASVAGGEVRVTTDSIANRLRYHIDALPDILAIKPRVSRKGNGVALWLEVEASADVNVPRKADEVLQIARQVIEDKMGLKLSGKPQIQIRMMPYPPGGVPTTAPAHPSSAQPPSSAPAPAFTPSLPEAPPTTSSDKPNQT
jgi:hypothetical protein